jgi:predicted enzyme related to lactoylglutathione lyase
MTTIEERTKTTASETATARGVDMKFEIVVIPVSDVDRAKEFYGNLGWRLDADFAFDNGFRIVQFTPPGSACSIQFGTNMTSAAPGTAQNMYLVVSDIEAARRAGRVRCRCQRRLPRRCARRAVPARRRGSRERAGTGPRDLQIVHSVASTSPMTAP